MLKAAFALPMTGRDLHFSPKCSVRAKAPRHRVQRIVGAVGRGGGKDSVAQQSLRLVATTSDFSIPEPGRARERRHV